MVCYAPHCDVPHAFLAPMQARSMRAFSLRMRVRTGQLFGVSGHPGDDSFGLVCAGMLAGTAAFNLPLSFNTSSVRTMECMLGPFHRGMLHAAVAATEGKGVTEGSCCLRRV